MPLSPWPALWAEPRAPGAPARSWRDGALVGVFCGLAVIEGLTRPDLPGGFGAVLLVFLLAPTLLWRRRRRCAIGPSAGSASSIGCAWWSGNGSPATCTTRSPTT